MSGEGGVDNNVTRAYADAVAGMPHLGLTKIGVDGFATIYWPLKRALRDRANRTRCDVHLRRKYRGTLDQQDPESQLITICCELYVQAFAEGATTSIEVWRAWANAFNSAETGAYEADQDVLSGAATSKLLGSGVVLQRAMGRRRTIAHGEQTTFSTRGSAERVEIVKDMVVALLRAAGVADRDRVLALTILASRLSGQYQPSSS